LGFDEGGGAGCDGMVTPAEEESGPGFLGTLPLRFRSTPGTP